MPATEALREPHAWLSLAWDIGSHRVDMARRAAWRMALPGDIPVRGIVASAGYSWYYYNNLKPYI